MFDSYTPQNPSHSTTDENDLGLNGRPAGWRNPQPSEPYHLLVIGAGPSGLVADRKSVV